MTDHEELHEDDGVQGLASAITEEDEAQGTAEFTVAPTGMSAQVLEGGAAPFDEGNTEEMSSEVITHVESSREDTPTLEGDQPQDASQTSEQDSPPVVSGFVMAEVTGPTPKIPMGSVSICRMVEYRSRTGNYSVPAVVNCCVDSIYQPGVEAGFVPPLSSLENVHLTVFSPGRPGMRMTAGETPSSDAFLVASQYPVSENVSGCYQEWDIPYDSEGGPGTWRWPTRV
jgi:hypothetical protein